MVAIRDDMLPGIWEKAKYAWPPFRSNCSCWCQGQFGEQTCNSSGGVWCEAVCFSFRVRWVLQSKFEFLMFYVTSDTDFQIFKAECIANAAHHNSSIDVEIWTWILTEAYAEMIIVFSGTLVETWEILFDRRNWNRWNHLHKLVKQVKMIQIGLLSFENDLPRRFKMLNLYWRFSNERSFRLNEHRMRYLQSFASKCNFSAEFIWCRFGAWMVWNCNVALPCFLKMWKSLTGKSI